MYWRGFITKLICDSSFRLEIRYVSIIKAIRFIRYKYFTVYVVSARMSSQLDAVRVSLYLHNS